jgi:hypothetical protein
MQTIEAKPLEESTNPKKTNAKIWLWLFPIFAVCTLSFCVIAGGLIFWQTRANSGAESDIIAAASPQNQLERNLSAPTFTPTALNSLAAPVDETTPFSCPADEVSFTPLVTTPLLSPVTFATQQDNHGWPLDPSLQFTTTVTRVLATFSFVGMQDGVPWERVWYFGEDELSRGSGVWNAGPTGKLTVQAMLNQGGFAPGQYKLEIYIAGQLLSQGTFVVVKEDTPGQRPVQVAYATFDGQKHQLNLLDLATNQTELLIESARSPAWSPDAKGLLFFTDQGLENGTPGLWVYNVGQRKAYQLNEESAFQGIVWSPHRTYIATTRTEGQGSSLVLWDINQNQSFAGPAGADPAWSPEGQRLAYRTCDETGWHISVAPVVGPVIDTSRLLHLTSGDDSQPAWSWDGQWLAFIRREGNNQDLYVIRSDGSNLVRLTDTPTPEVSPAWGPDNHLLFQALRAGQWNIYSINADGSAERQLVSTSSPTEWQPDRLAVSTAVLVADPPAPGSQVQVPAGRGLLAVSNQVNNDEMTFTIDNVEHKIGPYQLRMLPLKPGRYTWTASWPGKNSRTGSADISLGQVAYPVVER